MLAVSGESAPGQEVVSKGRPPAPTAGPQLNEEARAMASIVMAVLVVLMLLEWQITKLTQRVRQLEVDIGAKPGYLTRGEWLSKFRGAAEKSSAEESSKRAS